MFSVPSCSNDEHLSPYSRFVPLKHSERLRIQYLLRKEAIKMAAWFRLSLHMEYRSTSILGSSRVYTEQAVGECTRNLHDREIRHDDSSSFLSTGAYQLTTQTHESFHPPLNVVIYQAHFRKDQRRSQHSESPQTGSPHRTACRKAVVLVSSRVGSISRQ